MAATGIQPWVNGPVDFYVGTGAGGALEKLGFTEGGTNVQQIVPAVPFHSDDLGPETPSDTQLYPEHDLIEFDLNQWDETVWRKLVTRVYNIGTQTGTPGTWDMLDPGSFMVLEGYAFRLLLDNPYAAKTAFNGATPYNFLNVTLEGTVRDGPLGTKPRKHAGIFHAFPKKYAVGGGTYSPTAPYKWITYNTSNAGKPGGL